MSLIEKLLKTTPATGGGTNHLKKMLGNTTPEKDETDSSIDTVLDDLFSPDETNIKHDLAGAFDLQPHELDAINEANAFEADPTQRLLNIRKTKQDRTQDMLVAKRHEQDRQSESTFANLTHAALEALKEQKRQHKLENDVIQAKKDRLEREVEQARLEAEAIEMNRITPELGLGLPPTKPPKQRPSRSMTGY